jgi:hypothetical protein
VVLLLGLLRRVNAMRDEAVEACRRGGEVDVKKAAEGPGARTAMSAVTTRIILVTVTGRFGIISRPLVSPSSLSLTLVGFGFCDG